MQIKFMLGLTWGLYNACIPGKGDSKQEEDGEGVMGVKSYSVSEFQESGKMC
jgi:hypothetical protein